MDRLDAFEALAVDLVAKVAPWVAPIPTAYLVGRATVRHFSWPVEVGVISAVIVEVLGLATTATALELYQYNQGKRKTDPASPFFLSVVLVFIYFFVATGLTVALEIAPGMALYAPAIFPSLSLTGVTVLALRLDHKRRMQAIAQEKAERREARQVHRGEVQFVHHKNAQVSGENEHENAQDIVQSGVLDAVNRTRRARREASLKTLLDAYRSNPHLGATEAASRLGVHRNTIYNYTEDLVNTGRLLKNGNGWEVLG